MYMIFSSQERPPGIYLQAIRKVISPSGPTVYIPWEAQDFLESDASPEDQARLVEEYSEFIRRAGLEPGEISVRRVLVRLERLKLAGKINGHPDRVQGSAQIVVVQYSGAGIPSVLPTGAWDDGKRATSRVIAQMSRRYAQERDQRLNAGLGIDDFEVVMIAPDGEIETYEPNGN